MSLVIPFTRADAILADFIAVGGEIVGAVAHLFENDYAPNIDTVIGDFVEATFTGYVASSAIVWSEPFRNALGQAQVVGDTKVFELDALPGTIIYGYYLTVGGAYRGAERFPEPVPLAVVGNPVVLVPTYSFGSV